MYFINISVNLIFGFYRFSSPFCPNSIIFYCPKIFIRKIIYIIAEWHYFSKPKLFQFNFFTSVSNSTPIQNPFLKLVFSSSKFNAIVSFIRISNSAAKSSGSLSFKALYFNPAIFFLSYACSFFYSEYISYNFSISSI